MEVFVELPRNSTSKYVGRVFTRRDGPYNQRAVRVIGFTQLGYVRCVELKMKRLTDHRCVPGTTDVCDYIGITQEVDTLVKRPVVNGKLCTLTLNNEIVIKSSRVWWTLVDDFSVTYCVHSRGWTPGCNM